MAETVYVLCAVTAVICATLLIRSYTRSKVRLLLWSSICFIALALSNILVVVDLVLVPSIDFHLYRSGIALVGVLILAFGLVWEST
jgi:hypothetical protein